MPGKFNNDLDRAIYEITLDGGGDEQCGDVSEMGWWGCIMRDGRALAREVSDLNEGDEFDITPEDLEELRTTGKAGVVVTEDDQGFVHVQMFSSKKKLEDEWEACLIDAAEEDGPEDAVEDLYDSDYSDE